MIIVLAADGGWPPAANFTLVKICIYSSSRFQRSFLYLCKKVSSFILLFITFILMYELNHVISDKILEGNVEWEVYFFLRKCLYGFLASEMLQKMISASTYLGEICTLLKIVVSRNEILFKYFVPGSLYIWYPADNYMFKNNNRNTKTKCDIFSKLITKIPERRQWRGLGNTFWEWSVYLKHLPKQP